MTATSIRATARPSTDGRAVASYERLSRFKESVGFRDVEVSVAEDRQAEDAAHAAEELGLGPIGRHYRGDRSASEFRTKERDAFERLLVDIANGEVGVVLCWVFDRIIRDPADQERLFRLCKANGVRLIQTATRRELNLADPDDVTMARIQGALAAGEVAKASMRIRRAKRANAELGRPPGGGRRFGFTSEWEEHPTEAPLVRELVSRFLAGESLFRLAGWLNAQGVKGVRGGTWTGPNLRHLLGAPHLAGLRVHQGEVIGKAAWDGIIPVETHHHVVAMLSEPTRRTNGTGTNARKYLLVGLGVCDECGSPLRGRPRTARGEEPIYRCPTGRHVHRPMELVDALVEAAMVERLARFDPAAGVLVDDEATAELARLTEARAAMDEEYSDLDALRRAGDLTPRAFALATSTLEADMEATDAAIRTAAAEVDQASRILDGAMGPAAAEAWAGWSLARRRAAIAELAEVRLRGGRRGRHSFRPEDVVVNWR